MFKLPEFDPDWAKACLSCKHLRTKHSGPEKICEASPIDGRGRGVMSHKYALWAIIEGPCGEERVLREPKS